MLLATIEDGFALPRLANAKGAATLFDLLPDFGEKHDAHVSAADAPKSFKSLTHTLLSDVRFGSKADMIATNANGRSQQKGRWAVQSVKDPVERRSVND